MTSLNGETTPGGNTGISIAEEMLETFRLASAERMVITLQSPADAEALRFKLHHVRKQMRRYSHPLLSLAERVTFKVQGSQLIAQPSTDAKFRDVLGQALHTARKRESRAQKRERKNVKAST